jgi:hypothetical protein
MDFEAVIRAFFFLEFWFKHVTQHHDMLLHQFTHHSTTQGTHLLACCKVNVMLVVFV